MAADGAMPDPELIGPRPKADRSIAALLADLANETIQLIRQEIGLLRVEFGAKISRVGRGVAVLSIGGMIAFSGWLFLLAAGMFGLARVVPLWLAALIVALAALAVGGGLVLLAKRSFDADALVPRRTLDSLRRDETWLKGKIR